MKAILMVVQWDWMVLMWVESSVVLKAGRLVVALDYAMVAQKATTSVYLKEQVLVDAHWVWVPLRVEMTVAKLVFWKRV